MQKTTPKTWLTFKSELKTLRSYGDVTETVGIWTNYTLTLNGQTIKMSGEPERNLVVCIEVGDRYFRRVSQAVEAVQGVH